MKTLRIKQAPRWSISAKMNIFYSVVEHPNLFSSKDPNLFGEITNISTLQQRRLIIIDKKIERLYGEKIRSYFIRHKIAIKILPIKTSEKNKSVKTLINILQVFENFKLLRRKEPVIAIGGGVLLDIVGLAASLYRRGIPYIRVPTTLIGLVDAGIGVKTGVNFEGHKNILGTYHQPLISYIDPTFLTTLESRHISNGLAEILKIGLIKNASLFNLLEKHGQKLLELKLQNLTVSRIILHKAIEEMLGELEVNLWEYDLERLVDFGHTFSGALEMKALSHLLHGEAVNIDMALVSVLAHRRKLITKQELSRILLTMINLQLPIYHEACKPNLLYDALMDTTSHRDGLQRFPIPVGIGKAKFVNDISYAEIKLASYTLKEISKNL